MPLPDYGIPFEVKLPTSEGNRVTYIFMKGAFFPESAQRLDTAQRAKADQSAIYVNRICKLMVLQC